MYNMNELKRKINSDSLVEKCRKNKKDFTRNRKLQAKDLILFTLNNRGKTLKMELYDYIKEFNLEEVWIYVKFLDTFFREFLIFGPLHI